MSSAAADVTTLREPAARVRVVTADMNAFATGARFDRVMSVEMFEHMRNYAELFRRIGAWLKDDGRFFMQSQFLIQDDIPNNEFTTRFYDDGRTIVSQVPENRDQMKLMFVAIARDPVGNRNLIDVDFHFFEIQATHKLFNQGCSRRLVG